MRPTNWRKGVLCKQSKNLLYWLVRHGDASLYCPCKSSDQCYLCRKGQLVIHLGNVPDKYQKIQVPVWSDQNGQDDLIWYPVERSDKGFDLQVPLTNHSDQAGLYHVHVYGVEANEQLTGLYPLTTSVQQKTWLLPSQNHDHTHLLTRIWGRPKVVRRRWRDCLPHLVRRKWAGWFGLVSCKEERTWTFPTALSSSKTQREAGYFISTSTRKAKDN